MSIDATELIIDLSFKNLALEKKVKELEGKLAEVLEELKGYREPMNDLATAIGHPGLHPYNMVGIIKEKLREGAPNVR